MQIENKWKDRLDLPQRRVVCEWFVTTLVSLFVKFGRIGQMLSVPRSNVLYGFCFKIMDGTLCEV